MRIFACIAIVMLLALSAKAQHKTEPMPEGIYESIIGVVTDSPDDFYKIVDFLREADGIYVESYCFQNKLISIVFLKEKFKELNEVFFFIQSYFTDAKCFDKSMTKDMYKKECNSELAKQK